ncbi:MAG TPA: hypothetical protein VFF91_10035 [Pseudoxanthomonas sp.]|nr:hypothetical protein [Pseudoxanthomonas sp.]
MKKKFSLRTVGLVVAALMPAAALAQEGSATQPVATLQVQSGNVQTTNAAGDFVPASSGVQLAPGNRVLVPAGGSAVVTYPNGCQVVLTTPGVHTVAPTCVAGVGTSSGTAAAPNAAGTVALVAGGVALTAVAMEETLDDEDDERPPVSR